MESEATLVDVKGVDVEALDALRLEDQDCDTSEGDLVSVAALNAVESDPEAADEGNAARGLLEVAVNTA